MYSGIALNYFNYYYDYDYYSFYFFGRAGEKRRLLYLTFS